MEGKTLWLSVGMVAAVVIGIGMFVLYGGGPPPAPERPKPPPPPEQLMNTVLRFSPTVYRALVEQDAKRLGVAAPKPEELAQPFPYFEELRSRKKIKPKDPIETAHLKIALEVQKREASLEGQRFSFDHLVLRIENRTQSHLAYRVLTHVPDARKCQSKGDIAHNAIVILPGEAILRTECLFRAAAAVDVDLVEVMELTPLAAHYVSRMPATSILFDARTTAGHVPLKGQPCPQTFSWREIQDGLYRKQIGWKDVIDFYARHNCEEYSFFAGYRYRSDPAAPLPARPLD